MGKKLRYTPRSMIRSAIRRLWLRSRERQAALKRDNYSCCVCGVKQSRRKGAVVKVEVHHKYGVGNWERLIDEFYTAVLVDPSRLETLCKACHDKKEK